MLLKDEYHDLGRQSHLMKLELNTFPGGYIILSLIAQKNLGAQLLTKTVSPGVEIDLRSSQLVFLQRTLSLALENRLVALNNGKLTYESNLLQKLDALLLQKHGFRTPRGYAWITSGLCSIFS